MFKTEINNMHMKHEKSVCLLLMPLAYYNVTTCLRMKLIQIIQMTERRRGRVVRALGRGAAGRRFESGRKRLENSHCPPSSEWVPGG